MPESAPRDQRKHFQIRGQFEMKESADHVANVVKEKFEPDKNKDVDELSDKDLIKNFRLEDHVFYGPP